MMANSQKEMPFPSLLFAPAAWGKVVYFLDHCDRYVRGIGITDPQDPLFVRDFRPVSEAAWARYVEEKRAEAAMPKAPVITLPQPRANIVIITHPFFGSVCTMEDHRFYWKMTNGLDWSILLILDRERNYSGTFFCYCNDPVVMGEDDYDTDMTMGKMPVLVKIDCGRAFVGSDHALWESECRLYEQESPGALPQVVSPKPDDPASQASGPSPERPQPAVNLNGDFYRYCSSAATYFRALRGEFKVPSK